MNVPDSNPRVHSEPPTASSQLLAGVRVMDPKGWSRMVGTFGPIVYGWCRASGVREADASDLVQEIFIAVARGVGNFERKRSEGSFRAWLATITRNKVRDFFRRQARATAAEGGTAAHNRLQQLEEKLDSTICAETAQTPIVREVLEQVRAEFERKTWDAFWWTTVDGLQTAEVAQQLQMSTASVYQAKSRILRRLRERLAELP